ncbi:MAG: DsbA family protein [bacterium]|nr:DsbA family protein [bacterium]
MESHNHHHAERPEGQIEEVSVVNNQIVEKKPDRFLAISILISAVMVSGAVLYSKGGLPQVAGVVPSIDPNAPGAVAPAGGVVPTVEKTDVVLGNANAPVTLIEFADYQCPFCGRFFSQVASPLREEYIKTGKVKMVFRNFQFLGPESLAAGAAAECAKDQGKFWEYHDALFSAEIKDAQEHNGNLNRELFVDIASDLKLNANTFAQCVDSKKYDAKIAADTQDAQKYGVNSTPTSFVNGTKVLGAQPYAQFKTMIEAELAAK